MTFSFSFRAFLTARTSNINLINHGQSYPIFGFWLNLFIRNNTKRDTNLPFNYELSPENRETDLQRVSKVNSDLQKQLNNSSSQIQKIKTAKNITRKFNSAVRMVCLNLLNICFLT